LTSIRNPGSAAQLTGPLFSRCRAFARRTNLEASAPVSVRWPRICRFAVAPAVRYATRRTGDAPAGMCSLAGRGGIHILCPSIRTALAGAVGRDGDQQRGEVVLLGRLARVREEADPRPAR